MKDTTTPASPGHCARPVACEGRRTGLLTLLGVVLVSVGSGCAAPDPVAPSPVELCAQDQDALAQSGAALKVGFDAVLATLAGKAGLDEVEALAAHFETSQQTYRTMGEGLCSGVESSELSEGAYARHRYCHDQRLLGMAAVTQALAQVSADTDARHLVWLLGAKRDWLAQSAACHERARMLPEAFEGIVKVRSIAAPSVLDCHTSPQGFVNGGALTLQDAGAKPARTCRDLTLETELICERQVAEGQYEAVKACNGASLQKDDRFRIAFKATPSAYLYFFLYNSSGQFQMFFPGPTTDNKVEGGEPFMMPSHDNPEYRWIFLDDVDGVLEQIQIVASSAPIKELEVLRGADIKPGQDKRFPIPAQRTRGMLEPVATRGTSLEPVATRGGVYKGGTVDIKSNKEDSGLPSKIVATGKDVAVAEFIIRHEAQVEND